MGWYHDPNFNWDSGSAPACSINDKPAKQQQEEAAKPIANTACPLPADSSPPPPPPDVDSIYHLCQKSFWEQAVKKKQPYFPPTYMKDGKFTRATVFQTDLVATANQFYKDHPGDWIVLELDCQILYGLGIPILAQDAPESTPKQPVKCVQVFGGLSTTLPGLVKKIFTMQRASDGTFLKLVDNNKDLKEGQGEEKRKKEVPKESTQRRTWFKIKK